MDTIAYRDTTTGTEGSTDTGTMENQIKVHLEKQIPVFL